ncbi:MAG: transcription elongation factor GreA [Acidimicrobiia bacterium]|nr:transcription elongation factor GreA [Acidimicrobiia bacterium]MYC58419.1 transcription elongation factor GreA [Acidimicrobiia bacterium]MYG94178.1 transcription elongation factor GreA [Acidimicrobiia bacterium]MYI30475.1 transcription elongation factor GreA [Acidimicrobiia bacterium]
MSEVHELSQAAHDRLQAEFEHLTTVGRVEIARKIEAARELGDLSENGDYHAAKDEQGKMETRIAQLGALLRHSRIVKADNTDTVSVGSVVTIAYEGDLENNETYLVGSIEERHDGLDVMSPASPLGSAIIGAQVGDTVSYESPSGQNLSVRILALEQ